MKWPLWKWGSTVAAAGIILLAGAVFLIPGQRDRALNGLAKGARGLPGPGGMLEAVQFQDAPPALMKTMGVDLTEQDDRPAPRVQSGPLRLIRTGQVSLEVADFEKTAKELGRLVAAMGGYVADTQDQRSPSGIRSGSMTVRIPSASYESADSKIRMMGKILSARSNIQDVTKAYADLETRIGVKREAVGRIRELLRTKAGNLKDVLEAEKEITRITEEIDLADGERRFFDHQILLSTITVELSEPERISLARPSSWSALSEAVKDSMGMIAGSLALLLRIVLILLPWAALGGGLVWVVRRRRKGLPKPLPAEQAAGTE